MSAIHPIRFDFGPASGVAGSEPEVDLPTIARRALWRAARLGRGPADRRRHAVLALIAARPRLAPAVALRLVKRVEGVAMDGGLPRTA
ncbi:hypothetical protein KAJ83_13720 [Marivibrio halodurans]|uniref:Uncharacterized protein n=1 Tax=Marivibrio halodurans TaxID=2039722 RepID=A0A8J7V3L1_9PROT|nr:hypothetical protein [Marivibrio halodurans]MBP5858072.1 hypothetical protein [Marivibrio halodurans]